VDMRPMSSEGTFETKGWMPQVSVGEGADEGLGLEVSGLHSDQHGIDLFVVTQVALWYCDVLPSCMF
jgi:hypothetical protein